MGLAVDACSMSVVVADAVRLPCVTIDLTDATMPVGAWYALSAVVKGGRSTTESIGMTELAAGIDNVGAGTVVVTVLMSVTVTT